MGNSVFGDALSVQTDAAIHKFYTSSTWVDGRAEEQLREVSKRKGIQKIAAFPDFHPGQFGPVGCAILADRIYPELIGNDIGCGMALFKIDKPLHKIRLDKLERQLRKLEDAPLRPDGFGTIGGGNHFCEILKRVEGDSFDANHLYALIHTGSRAMGARVFNQVLPLLHDGYLELEHMQNYLAAHDHAVTFAKANRAAIASHLCDILGAHSELIADSPHNLIEAFEGGWLHRKGAAKAGGLVPLAGSRSAPSYLMQCLINPDALSSLAHGAGRRYSRKAMHGRMEAKKVSLNNLSRNQYGGRIICDNRQMLIEEAPDAYKSIETVVGDLVQFNIAKPVARFLPLVTYKTANHKDDNDE